MMLRTSFEPPDLLVAALGGVITPHDQAEFVEWVRRAIRTNGAVRLLILLEHFSGWTQAALNDVTLWLRDDEGVTRMAIVGPPERRLGVLTTIGQPLRQMPIRYFDSQVAARRWVLEGRADATGDVASTSATDRH